MARLFRRAVPERPYFGENLFRRTVWGPALLLLFVILLLWDPLWSLAGVRQLFPWELVAMLKAPEGERPLLLDVRSPMEYRLFHIPGARNRPASRLVAGRARLLNELEFDRPVVIVCMSGHRSPPVATWLNRAAPKIKTYNLTWGMLGWFLTGGATVSGE